MLSQYRAGFTLAAEITHFLSLLFLRLANTSAYRTRIGIMGPLTAAFFAASSACEIRTQCEGFVRPV